MTKPIQKKKPIPFSFVFDYLYPKELVVKPMFGCYALYDAGKIVLILRKKQEHRGDNGLWVATDREYHHSLRKELPSMRSIRLLGKGPMNWQVIPESAKDFESSVIRACELVVKGDSRIGRVPKRKVKKS